MTSLAVSLSVDSRGPCGLYFITDSRITWGSSDHRWDAGQKTFASRRFPDVFGYCGDAYFPPMMLRQVVDQLDAGLICLDNTPPERHRIAIARALEVAMQGVVGRPPMLPFTIYHGAREGDGMSASFRLWQMRYSPGNGSWSTAECPIDTDHSYLVTHDGSGSNVIRRRETDWKKTEAAGTSRSAVWAFCEALQSGQDPLSGGPPQLVGLWRTGAGKTFGFFWHGKPYLAGMQVQASASPEEIKWFNHLFERCDGATGKRLKSAQKHVKPDIVPLRLR